MLYSLSKSVGTSLNLYQNCRAFLKTLAGRLDLDYTAVWLKHSLLTRSGDAVGARLVCSVPKISDLEERLDGDHPLIRELRGSNRFTLTSENPLFAETPVGKAQRSGVIVAFGLGNLGVLELFVSDPDKQPTEEQLEHLTPVIYNFTQSVGNCLAYDRIRVNENKYRSLFEESRDAVFISTPSGRFLDINPAGAQMLGYTIEEARLLNIGRQVYDNPKDRERYIKNMTQLGHVQAYEQVLKRKDGKLLYVLETSSVVHDETGEITAFRGIMRDVTEHRQMQQQLSQKQRMESLGLLAGGVAHDFNNLLTGMLGFTALIQSHIEGDETLKEYLSSVEESALKAHSLTKQLLSFVRGGDYDPRPLRLNALVLETTSLLRRLIGATIEIRCRLKDGLPSVDGDSNQLQQVIMNLCINARDAMPDGGQLTVTTELTPDGPPRLEEGSGVYDRPFILMTVADTGCGMDEETIQRIFEPFFTTKDEDKGTGLGLALVYGVVTHHGGGVSVESALGKGSTFKVYLPVSGKAV
jgi:PAS domain S-box-containing protein